MLNSVQLLVLRGIRAANAPFRYLYTSAELKYR
jgi:hypothetical protein